MNEKIIIRRQLFLELTFIIMVEDGFACCEEYDGTLTLGILENAKPYIIPSEIGNLEFYFAKNDVRNLVPGDQKNEFIGNVSKVGTFSSVLVRYPEESFSIRFPLEDLRYSETIEKNLLTEPVIESLNKFLMHYKILNDRHYIPRISSYNIFRFHFEESYNDGTSVIILLYRPYGHPVPFENTLEYSKDEVLRNNLEKEIEVDLFDRLESEIQNKIFLEDYRMVVIESIIWLESWIVPFLKDIYKTKKQLSGKKIKRIFNKTIIDNDGKEINIPVFINEILKEKVFEATGFPYQHTAQYYVLRTSLNLRNNLAHGLNVEVTRDQAIQAYDMVRYTISILKRYEEELQKLRNIKDEWIQSIL